MAERLEVAQGSKATRGEAGESWSPLFFLIQTRTQGYEYNQLENIVERI